ncbi:MAG: hypothetical protein KBH99_06655 [Syntrophobacteraceae bacterium]|nr:hypothetical protein [Syntrophobacteraceae bacterium]
MLKEAAFGMALIHAEGAAPEAILAADMESCSILEAFHLLCRSLRLIATCVSGNAPSPFLFVGAEWRIARINAKYILPSILTICHRTSLNLWVSRGLEAARLCLAPKMIQHGSASLKSIIDLGAA